MVVIQHKTAQRGACAPIHIKIFDIARNKTDTSASHVRRFGEMTEDKEQAESDQKLMRYQILEREVTDPLAAGLLRQIVAELEARLPNRDERGVAGGRSGM